MATIGGRGAADGNRTEEKNRIMTAPNAKLAVRPPMRTGPAKKPAPPVPPDAVKRSTRLLRFPTAIASVAVGNRRTTVCGKAEEGQDGQSHKHAERLHQGHH